MLALAFVKLLEGVMILGIVACLVLIVGVAMRKF